MLATIGFSIRMTSRQIRSLARARAAGRVDPQDDRLDRLVVLGLLEVLDDRVRPERRARRGASRPTTCPTWITPEA